MGVGGQAPGVEALLPARPRRALAGLGPGTKHTLPDRTATRGNVDVYVDADVRTSREQ